MLHLNAKKINVPNFEKKIFKEKIREAPPTETLSANSQILNIYGSFGFPAEAWSLKPTLIMAFPRLNSSSQWFFSRTRFGIQTGFPIWLFQKLLPLFFGQKMCWSPWFHPPFSLAFKLSTDSHSTASDHVAHGALQNLDKHTCNKKQSQKKQNKKLYTKKTCHPKKRTYMPNRKKLKNSCLHPMFQKNILLPRFSSKKTTIQMGWIQLFPPTESTPTVEPNWIRWGSWASQGFVGLERFEVGTVEAQMVGIQLRRISGWVTWRSDCHLHMWKHRSLGQWKKRWWKFGWWKWWWIFGILHDPWFPFLPNFPNFSETDSRPKQSSSCTCVFVMVGW